MGNESFINLAVGSIGCQTFSFPFPFNTKIEIKMELPLEAFDAIYQAFSDKIPLRLTVCDIQCVFDCSIFYFEKHDNKSTPEIISCTIVVSSISCLVYSSRINEQTILGAKDIELEVLNPG